MLTKSDLEALREAVRQVVREELETVLVRLPKLETDCAVCCGAGGVQIDGEDCGCVACNNTGKVRWSER